MVVELPSTETPGGNARVRFEDAVAGRVDVATLAWPVAALTPAMDPALDQAAGAAADEVGDAGVPAGGLVGGAAAMGAKHAERKATRQRSWLTAAIPVDNPYCSCKLTRVRSRQVAAGASTL